MTFSTLCNRIFWDCITSYRRLGDVDAACDNPFEAGTIEARLYEKNWIDNVQWDLEDIIRDPEIKPEEALKIKRRIDRSNQNRTDLVEMIDSYFLEKFSAVAAQEGATLNTESPAWAVDRLSILSLKIYMMQQQATDLSATQEHRDTCQAKLDVLLEQRADLSLAMDQLLEAYGKGEKVMKVYKQMKMYNDPSLNPMLKGQAL
ncbi:MAG: hypothetical protein CSA97_02505 [Bacteroidetes bacterium]|nr:MAG: hypothetical protein CSA97_02505 [Bacteroidota bacterium]